MRRKRMNGIASGIRPIDRAEPIINVPETMVMAGLALEGLPLKVWLVLKRYAGHKGDLWISNISLKKIAGEMAQEKIKKLFEKWDLYVEDSLFIVEALDWQYEIILDLQDEGVKFKDVVSKAVEFLARRKVSEIGVRYVLMLGNKIPA